MATLAGLAWIAETDKLVDAEITIDPVIPTLNGPHDAYHIRLGPNSDGSMMESTLILHGYCRVHNEFKFVAEMCREAEAVLTLPKHPVGVGRCGVTYETGWADFQFVQANTRKKPTDLDVALHVRYLVRNGPNPVWLQDRHTAFRIRTTVDNAICFGETLMGQLLVAWRKRGELGLSVDCEEEDWPAYFADDPKWSAYFQGETPAKHSP